MTSRHIVRSKIKAFRRQGFDVSANPLPIASVQVFDQSRVYLSLRGQDASAFIAVANRLAAIHALSVRDAYRLQAFRALQSHLQMTLPLDGAGTSGSLGAPLPLNIDAQRTRSAS